MVRESKAEKKLDPDYFFTSQHNKNIEESKTGLVSAIQLLC